MTYALEVERAVGKVLVRGDPWGPLGALVGLMWGSPVDRSELVGVCTGYCLPSGKRPSPSTSYLLPFLSQGEALSLGHSGA